MNVGIRKPNLIYEQSQSRWPLIRIDRLSWAFHDRSSDSNHVIRNCCCLPLVDSETTSLLILCPAPSSCRFSQMHDICTVFLLRASSSTYHLDPILICHRKVFRGRFHLLSNLFLFRTLCIVREIKAGASLSNTRLM